MHDKAANAEKDAVERLGDDEKKKIIRRMRMQIWAGAIVGKLTRSNACLLRTATLTMSCITQACSSLCASAQRTSTGSLSQLVLC